MQQHILIGVENDAARTFLADNLTADGYEVYPYGTGEEVHRALHHDHRMFHLVITDGFATTVQTIDMFAPEAPIMVLVPGDAT